MVIRLVNHIRENLNPGSRILWQVSWIMIIVLAIFHLLLDAHKWPFYDFVYLLAFVIPSFILCVMIAHGLIEWLTVYHCIKRLSDVKIDEVHAYESTKLKLELWPMFILVDSNPRRRKRYRFLDDASYTPFANSRVPTFLLKKTLKG